MVTFGELDDSGLKIFLASTFVSCWTSYRKWKVWNACVIYTRKILMYYTYIRQIETESNNVA